MLDADQEALRDLLADHGTRPRNHRLLDPFDHAAEGHNPLCGDRVQLRLRLDSGGRIADMAFQGRGCALSQASASLMTTALKDLTPAQALALFEALHEGVLGNDGPAERLIPPLDDIWFAIQPLVAIRGNPLRAKCITLAWHTMKSALTDGATATTE